MAIEVACSAPVPTVTPPGREVTGELAASLESLRACDHDWQRFLDEQLEYLGQFCSEIDQRRETLDALQVELTEKQQSLIRKEEELELVQSQWQEQCDRQRLEHEQSRQELLDEIARCKTEHADLILRLDHAEQERAALARELAMFEAGRERNDSDLSARWQAASRELPAQAAELDAKRRQIEGLTDELAEARSQRDHQAALLDEAKTEGLAARQAIEQAVAQQLDELQNRCRALEDECQEAQAARVAEHQRAERALAELEAGRSAAVDEQGQSRIAELESALSAARRESEQLRRALDSLAAQALGEPALGDAAEAESALRELQEQMAQLESDRELLEAELEIVRNRAAELVELAAQERRQMADERNQWAGELRQLRRLLELQSRILSERDTSAGHPPHELTALAAQHVVPPAGEPASGGAVVCSVIAQFEQLQRERQRRRASGKPAGKQEVA